MISCEYQFLCWAYLNFSVFQNSMSANLYLRKTINLNQYFQTNQYFQRKRYLWKKRKQYLKAKKVPLQRANKAAMNHHLINSTH